jgi:hypothetical protein
LIRLNAVAGRLPMLAVGNPAWSGDMHPILSEILTRPVGWLAIGGSIVMVGVGLAVFLFVRRQIRAEEGGGK